MKRQDLSVTALANELTKLLAVAVLIVPTTLSVGTNNPKNSADEAVQSVELIETETVVDGIETINDDTSSKIRELLVYIQRFESSGAVNSQGVQSAYQVVFGGIAAADRPTVALTTMTVAEVLAWQDSIDAHYSSEAAGAYQVMEDTLRGLVNSAQVDPEAVFNEATQDAVAELLMERRGLSKFVAGELSAEDFADNLAREWASFPVVRDQQGASRFVERGQSYYAGDGLNNAHADADEFLSVVESIRVDEVSLPEELPTTPTVATERGKAQHESAGQAETVVVSLGATKLVGGPVKINGQIDLANHGGWNISANAEYDIDSNTHGVGGTATYEKGDLSFSFSGSHTPDDSTLFDAELKFRF